MGYVALAILISVIIWTLWRVFTYKRIPLNYYSTLDNEKTDESKLQTDTKHEKENEGITPKIEGDKSGK